ncbi:hypothetical protein OG417_25775 [Actinoallomurus sp. NBC_01490]|uniref:hypothetical protein n=1 Tax=Actinoallomurus sp. NBC_01490 TaxID=2903557 RepID=UPI002E349522|nr:hypothetical protein [Actinoallomurus sp. NBC_01490]
MKLKTLAVAVATGAAALLPAAAVAATGGFYWSPDGSGTQSASLQNPQAGHCYTLRGTRPPFYAINATDHTVHYYRSAGCSGEAGSLPPSTTGNVTRYVKFD